MAKTWGFGRRPRRSLEADAYLDLQRTAAVLTRAVSERLRPEHLSPAQYNVLRILRGAGPGGLACGEIAERMLTRDPDVTRLLDRLEERRLVARTRARRDRRVVRTRVTASGLRLLARLDEPITRMHAAQLGYIGPAKLRALIRLLALARSKSGARSPMSALAAEPRSPTSEVEKVREPAGGRRQAARGNTTQRLTRRRGRPAP